MNEALRTALKQLRLSGMTQSLEVRLQEAAGNGLNHTEFLELILQDELLIRKERQIKRRIKAAMFRDLKTLEDFDWQFNPSIKKKLNTHGLLTHWMALQISYTATPNMLYL